LNNLAFKNQGKKVQKQQHEPQQQQSVQKLNKFRITLGEKIILIACGAIIASLAIGIISNSAKLYIESREIQTIETKMEDQTKLNNDLRLQVTELSSPERIRRIAEEELGMKLDSKKVKFVGK
jgi:cell division protein FtsL